MDLGIRGKTALVTGASKGIGRAVAEALAGEGARVFLVARSAERLQELAKALREKGAEADYLATDLAREDAAERIQKALRGFGEAELFLGNTGGPPPGAAKDLPPKAWSRAFDELFLPMVRLTQALLPGMEEKGFGRIVFVTSIAVKEPVENLALSNGIRAGLTGYLKTLSRELAPLGITANAVAPGYTATERVEALLAHQAEREGVPLEEVRRRLAETIPMRRLGRPEEVAAAAVFLMGVPAGYVTGQTFVVDGGYLRGLF